MEVWKPIVGYEGKYLVSNLGNIKSQWYIQHNEFPTPRNQKIFREKILSIFDNGTGYKFVYLMKDGKRKKYYVHRLVAEHFLNKKEGANVVNHKDYNPNNNEVTNLEWCTQSENILHSIDHYKRKKKWNSNQS